MEEQEQELKALDMTLRDIYAKLPDRDNETVVVPFNFSDPGNDTTHHMGILLRGSPDMVNVILTNLLLMVEEMHRQAENGAQQGNVAAPADSKDDPADGSRILLP